MIAKGKGCPYGSDLTNYITKNDRADIIGVNLLNPTATPHGMWNEMQIHFNRYKAQFGNREVKYPAVRFELSPSAEECKGWSAADWNNMLVQYLHILDNMTDFTNTKGIKRHLKKTNFSNTMYFAGLHRDSKSGYLHLHGLTSRLDKDGKLNDLHHIGERMVAAAQELNRQRGWKDAMTIRQEHLDFFYNECMAVLKEMPRFSLDDYFNRLTKRGHILHNPADSKGVIHGYSFKQPGTTNTFYKASELGEFQNKGDKRKLTVKNLEKTWKSLHANDVKLQGTSGHTSTGQHILSPYDKQNTGGLVSRIPENAPKVRPENYVIMARKNIKVNDKNYSICIPRNQFDSLQSFIEVDEDCAGNFRDVLNTACLLFMGYIDAATTFAQSYGGGGGDTGGWRGKDDDEDWKLYLMRCARQAESMSKKPVKTQTQSPNRPTYRGRRR